MSSYNGSRLIVNGGVVNHHTVISQPTHQDSALSILLNHSDPDGFHNSKQRSPPVTCHRATRTPILQAIVDSEEGIKSLSYPLLWLSGHPGAGKTTIAQTISEDLYHSKSLAAAYFFPLRGEVDKVITTIAYQLVQNIPPLRPYVEDAIERNPAVFHLSLRQQAQELILEPVHQLRKAVPSLDVSLLPQVIVIDGLDNCFVCHTPLVLSALLHIVRAQETFPFAVLVASRPERPIKVWFYGCSQPMRLYRTSGLHNSDNEKDITQFVTDQLNEIAEYHPLADLLPTNWVSPELIRLTVYRCAGQFVTAKTIMKHIRYSETVPSHRLHTLLNSGELKEPFFHPVQYDKDFLLLEAFKLPDDHTFDSSVNGRRLQRYNETQKERSSTTGSPDNVLPEPSPVLGSPFEFIQHSPASLPILIQPSSNFGSPFEALQCRYRR